MSLSEAITTQALWIQIWVGVIAVLNIATLAALLFGSDTRRDGITVGIAFIANYLLMNWLYGQFGYVRLLGLSHILIWIPLTAYLVLALKGTTLTGIARRITQAFVLCMCISLVFDITDVTRWLMGDQASMLPPSDG